MQTRIRTIKPEIAQHELLFDLEKVTGFPIRFAWTMLFTVCDREGRFEWRPRILKTLCLPYDDVDFEKILDVWNENGLIVRYTADGKTFGYIPTWRKHQVMNVRESKSKLPSPGVTIELPFSTGVNVPEPLRETVFARDGRKCVRCSSTEDPTIDHIFPQSCGGTHADSNLRTLCGSCNSARPVQGQALLEDLAKDGLTFADFDRVCGLHVHARACTWGTGTGTRTGTRTTPLPPAVAATDVETTENQKISPTKVEATNRVPVIIVHDDGTPQGLTEVEYARRFLGDVGLPEKGNIYVAADAIKALSKFRGLSLASSFEQMRAKALDDRDHGVAVDHLWILNGRYDQPIPRSKSDVASADYTNRFSRELEILRRSGASA
jgi:hypothetical protein